MSVVAGGDVLQRLGAGKITVDEVEAASSH